MKKKLLSIMFASMLSVSLLAGCGQTSTATTEATTEVAVEATTEAAAEATTEATDATEATTEATDAAAEATTEETAEAAPLTDDTTIRLAGLKGPTSMGMVKLLTDAQDGTSPLSIDFTMATSGDEITPSLIQGDLDIIAVPSNLASVLYNKTEGGVRVLAVNTLGVLSIVDTKDSVKSVADLKGKTLYATGQGTIPEYTLRYILSENGVDPDTDITIEWKSEPTEIVSLMTSSDEEVIAMLPQPFATVAATQVEGLNTAFTLNDEWNKLETESSIVTGVVVARTAFVEEHPELVNAFLDAYKASTEYVNTNVEDAAAMVEALDIVKAPIAKKAIPLCNITFLEGDEMKTAVSGYLQILSDENPKSIGGTMPADDFYYQR